MSMNEADILYGCIIEKIGDEETLKWLSKLYDLAEPNAEKVRQLERSIEELESKVADSVPKSDIKEFLNVTWDEFIVAVNELLEKAK